jgi:Zn-dependent protease/CBS domain-containing protein
MATAHEQKPARRWAWRIGSVAKIPIYLHFTLLLLFVWIAWTAAHSGGPIGPRLFFVVGLFGSVLLHELGHALMALRYGIRASDIVLYPFGGVARMESMGPPKQEFWIALAGPAVSILIGLVLLVGSGVTGQWSPPEEMPTTARAVLHWLMIANFVLAAFNLIPAFPLDGGRVLRAVFAGRMSMVRATSIAASIGQGFAILMGLAGLFMGNFLLMFIAFFVFISAGQEVMVQRSRAIMAGVLVKDAMITHYETLNHAATLGQAADLLLNSHQEDFPILAGSQILGVLTRPDLVRGLANHGPEAYVSGSISRGFIAVSPSGSLQEALHVMQEAKSRVALVLADEGVTARNVVQFIGAQDGQGTPPIEERPSAHRLVGMLTEENIQEYLQVHEAAGDLES